MGKERETGQAHPSYIYMKYIPKGSAGLPFTIWEINYKQVQNKPRERGVIWTREREESTTENFYRIPEGEAATEKQTRKTLEPKQKLYG
jgi:hypothetical protein